MYTICRLSKFWTSRFIWSSTHITNTFIVLGLPIGSSIGGYLFNHFGSITTFKMLSGAALVTCVIQIIVNLLINRWAKIGETKDRKYSKVEVKDNIEEDTTTM